MSISDAELQGGISYGGDEFSLPFDDYAQALPVQTTNYLLAAPGNKEEISYTKHNVGMIDRGNTFEYSEAYDPRLFRIPGNKYPVPQNPPRYFTPVKWINPLTQSVGDATRGDRRIEKMQAAPDNALSFLGMDSKYLVDILLIIIFVLVVAMILQIVQSKNAYKLVKKCMKRFK